MPVARAVYSCGAGGPYRAHLQPYGGSVASWACPFTVAGFRAPALAPGFRHRLATEECCRAGAGLCLVGVRRHRSMLSSRSYAKVPTDALRPPRAAVSGRRGMSALGGPRRKIPVPCAGCIGLQAHDPGPHLMKLRLGSARPPAYTRDLRTWRSRLPIRAAGHGNGGFTSPAARRLRSSPGTV